MKEFRPARWVLLVLLFLFIAAAGCGTTKAIYEGSKRATHSLFKKVTKPITRKRTDGLRKRVLLLPLLDHAQLGEEKVKQMTERFVSLLKTDDRLLVQRSNNPLPSTIEIRSPEYGILIDPDRAKRAEEMGMNVLLTLTLNPLEFHKKKWGIWPLRSVKREVEVSISSNALDIINGTLYLTKLESRRIRLLEDLMAWEEDQEEELRKSIDQKKLEKALSRMLIDQASAIKGALRNQPWSGRILSAHGQELIVSAGTDIGLKEGSVFEVFGKGESIPSAKGRAIHLLGPKIGEIKAVSVRESNAAAVPLTDTAFRAGQVIRLKK
jgi:hypothetical protein